METILKKQYEAARGRAKEYNDAVILEKREEMLLRPRPNTSIVWYEADSDAKVSIQEALSAFKLIKELKKR